MIKNYKKWRNFENNLIRKEKVNIIKNFKIIDALYREAISLKKLPPKNPLEGLNIKIRIAMVINSVSTTP